MAENLFAMLQKAHETASTGDAKQFGVEVGIVTNVDPSADNNAPAWAKAGNAVKVKFVRLPGGPESDWARVVQPAAGAGRGFYWVPHVNDEVLIAFERGGTKLLVLSLADGGTSGVLGPPSRIAGDSLLDLVPVGDPADLLAITDAGVFNAARGYSFDLSRGGFEYNEIGRAHV